MKTSVESRRGDPRCSPSSREQRVSDPAHRGLSLALYLAMAERPATNTECCSLVRCAFSACAVWSTTATAFYGPTDAARRARSSTAGVRAASQISRPIVTIALTS